MKYVLIPIAIGYYWIWLAQNPYYFQQTYTTEKPAVHHGAWFDGEGWRPGQ